MTVFRGFVFPQAAEALSGTRARVRARSLAVPAAFLLALAVLVSATRLPVAPHYLFSFDAVNFALALDHFDPRLHQPQPPGYPLFVFESRLINHLFHNPVATFVACSLIAATLASFVLFLLGSRMYSRWAGMAAALLLALNPLMWHSSLASPVRPYLALSTALVAYFCWRAIHGEPRYAYFAAIALGLCAGWRPALEVMLFPLWLGCACIALRSFRRVMVGLALLVAALSLWLAPLVAAIGGVRETWLLFTGYLGEQSQDGSPLFGSSFWGWWRMFIQGFVWFAICVAGWVWAMAFTRNRPRHWVFLLVWVTPPAIFFALIHVASPGHMLSIAPAFCLAGAAVLEQAARRVSAWLPRGYAPLWVFLAIALAINLWLFLYPFHIPHARKTRTAAAELVEQFRFWGAFALYDSSYVPIRAVMMRTEDRINLLNALGDAPGLAIVWQDDDVTWRKITYYFFDKPVWVLEGLNGPGATGRPAPRLWLNHHALEARHAGDFAPLRLPAAGRVAWLLHLESSFPKELAAQGVPLRKLGPVFLTDLAATPSRFRAGPFEFYKTEDPAPTSQ